MLLYLWNYLSSQQHSLFDQKFILVLNDNEWSIAKNVPFPSTSMSLLQIQYIINYIGKRNRFFHPCQGESRLLNSFQKRKGYQGVAGTSSIFEKIGLRYLGPIDGHDIDSLVHFLEFAKNSDEPIVLHVLT